MILLWGIPSDEPLVAVHEALRRRRATVAFLDQRAVLETEVELSVDGETNGRLRVREAAIALGSVTAVYLRPYESRRMPSVTAAEAGGDEAGHALAIEDTLVSWLDIAPARVVNRPTAMASNTSKPFQSALIAAQGLAVPATLITTDCAAVEEFLEEHGALIYKSVSGVRSIVSRLSSEDLGRLADVAWCPTQFQQYVPGTDVRVHVVGDELFACEIVSEADDYRYAGLDGSSSQLRACSLPAEIATRCHQLATALELPVAGIDLRRTPDGAWYCFEVNPAPGFSYFQKATGLPIDEAIAGFLLAG